MTFTDRLSLASWLTETQDLLASHAKDRPPVTLFFIDGPNSNQVLRDVQSMVSGMHIRVQKVGANFDEIMVEHRSAIGVVAAPRAWAALSANVRSAIRNCVVTTVAKHRKVKFEDLIFKVGV